MIVEMGLKCQACPAPLLEAPRLHKFNAAATVHQLKLSTALAAAFACARSRNPPPWPRVLPAYLQQRSKRLELRLHAALAVIKVWADALHERHKAPERLHLVAQHVQQRRCQVAHTLRVGSGGQADRR